MRWMYRTIIIVALLILLTYVFISLKLDNTEASITTGQSNFALSPTKAPVLGKQSKLKVSKQNTLPFQKLKDNSEPLKSKDDISFEERRTRWRTLKEELKAKSSKEVFNAMLDGFHYDNVELMNFARKNLIDRVRAGDQNVVSKIHERFLTLTIEEQIITAQAMAKMGSPESLEVIIELAQLEALDLQVRGSLINGIRRIPISREDDIAPVVEQLDKLVQSNNNTGMRYAALSGLTYIGTEPAVLILAQELERSGGEDANLNNTLLQLRSKPAIDEFSRRLFTDLDLSSPISLVGGDVLAKMGRPEATRELLRWAQIVETPESANQAVEWLKQARDSTSLNLIEQAASSDQSFKNPSINTRLSQFIETWKLSSKPLLQGRDF